MTQSRSSVQQSLPGLGLVLGAGVGLTIGLAIAGGPGIALGAGIGAGIGLVVGAIVQNASTRHPADRR